MPDDALSRAYTVLSDAIGQLAPWLPWLLIGAGGLGAFLMWRAGRRRRACRWRRIGPHRGTRFTQWRCRACGADAFAQGRKPPRDCKRGLRDRPL